MPRRQRQDKRRQMVALPGSLVDYFLTGTWDDEPDDPDYDTWGPLLMSDDELREARTTHRAWLLDEARRRGLDVDAIVRAWAARYEG